MDASVARMPPAGTAKSDLPAHISLTELLFFAYRDFTGEPDAVLATLNLGRAHHRTLHFVARNPGLRVANLLVILRITKQSLARVLKDLLDHGWLEQRAGEEDRRERHLYLTERGRELAEHLMRLQSQRIAKALAEAGLQEPHLVEAFLYAMISENERASVSALIGNALRVVPDAGSADTKAGKLQMHRPGASLAIEEDAG